MCNISSLYLNRGIDIGITKGIDIGINKGIDIGINKGIDIGINKGKAEGAFEVTVKMIIKLFKKGMSVADIADAVELSVSETEKIIKENT